MVVWCIYHHHTHHPKVWQENFPSPETQVEFRGGGGGGGGGVWTSLQPLLGHFTFYILEDE